MSTSAHATMVDRDFVCVGCGRRFPSATRSKYVKQEVSGRSRFLVFHSVDCLIGWERQARR
jgi:hypothetical protein